MMLDPALAMIEPAAQASAAAGSEQQLMDCSGFVPAARGKPGIPQHSSWNCWTGDKMSLE
jgi:hypothetical protein